MSYMQVSYQLMPNLELKEFLEKFIYHIKNT